MLHPRRVAGFGAFVLCSACSQPVAAVGFFSPAGFQPDVYYPTLAGLIALLLLGFLYGVSRRGAKQTPAALQEIQERSQTIYESAAGAILVLEESGNIHSANPAAEVMTGYSSKELLKMKFSQFLGDAQRSRWGEIIEAPPGEASDVLELPIIRADGGTLAVEIKTSPIELSGTPFHMVLMRDVTVRKKAEVELFKEKELLAVTLASIEGGVITTDIQGQVMSMNRAAEKFCRMKKEDGVGQPFSEVLKLSISGSRRTLEPVADAISTRKTVKLPLDTRLVTGPDSSEPVRVVCEPLMSSEYSVMGVVVVIEDVSHRFQAEEELQRATKLESIGTLAGGIAHDFNNIMTSVIGNLSLANTFLDEKPAPEVKACIEHAQRSSWRAKSLTSQLLTFSTGGDPVKQIASMTDILKDAADFGLSGSSVKLRQVLEDNLWAVNVDIHQIVQALSNVLINAKEASPAGEIVIQACNLRLNVQGGVSRTHLDPGRYIQIIITDTGGGIPADIAPKIFDPYFSTKEKGSGLGLAATYSIIKNHGGSIEADSEPGKGATFTLFLPASDRAIKKIIKPKASLVTGTGRILIMDDEVSIRRITAFMLKKMGFEPNGAASGEEAIEMYIRARDEGAPYLAILMDLTIPGGMGGQEAMARLRELDPNVKAIVSSGYFTDPVMAQHKKYGFIGVLPKPYSIQELGAAIEDALKLQAEITAG